MNLNTYGFHLQTIPEHSTGLPARITAVHRDRFELVCEQGSGFARLKASEYRSDQACIPVTGDFVLLDFQADGESRILETLPRTSYFSRLDPSSSGHKEQAVAANFDYVFILQSLDHDFNLHRLERYLTLAWQSGATPVVILTKADGVDSCSVHLHAAKQLATDVEVFAISAKTGEGLGQLTPYLLPGKTIVLLGSSGVGKSTLVNTLSGESLMATNGTRHGDGRGRHTTSHRQLILLNQGVMIIDTPGMRELGMVRAQEGLAQSFSDVEQHLGHCKFTDCQHQTEPGCGIKKAISSGALTLERWERHQALKQESKFVTDKDGYLREKQQWGKDIAKFQRQQRAVDYRHTPCVETFFCGVCGAVVTANDAGSKHRNHCPQCLSSMHVDHTPGDRASLCHSVMDPIGVWVRKNGEWAIIHRCRSCGALSSNRIAADDNNALLISIAVKPLASPPFPLWQLTQGNI